MAPPEEPPRSTRTRSLIVLAVSLFVLVFGVPLFLYTTSIHKADLPIPVVQQKLNEFENNVRFEVPVYFDNVPPEIVNKAQDLVDQILAERYQIGRLWSLSLKTKEHMGHAPKSLVVSLVNITDHQSEFEGPFSHSIGNSSRNLTIHSKVADSKYLEHYISQILLDQVFHEELSIFSALHAGDRNSDSVFPYSSSYNVIFNLFVEDGRPVTWDIEDALESMRPIFAVFENYCSFEVSSQIQYYSKLHDEPDFNESLSANIISKSALSTFVNYGEWNLNTHGNSPSINFLVYFSKGNYNNMPLLVEDSKTNSFLIPQWGGVSIYNPALPILKGSNLRMDKQVLLPILDIFASQLFELLGVPKSPKSTALRLDSFERIATFKNLKISLNNLSALMKLAGSFSGISIPEATRVNVEESLSFYDFAVEDIKNQDFASSVSHAAKSVKNSDKAFFEKEMVQQAYFPNEHKLAVFLPLLGPICSIVFFGLIKLLKDRRNKGHTSLEKKEI